MLRRTRRSRTGPHPAVSIMSGGGSLISLNLSSATVLSTASVGTVIGTLSVTGGTGAYTFSLTSNPGALFSITTNQLKVAASLSAGSDPITIKADNGAGSVVSKAFLITVTPPGGTVALTADFSASGNESWFFY
jgi:hypothetical protein